MGDGAAEAASETALDPASDAPKSEPPTVSPPPGGHAWWRDSTLLGVVLGGVIALAGTFLTDERGRSAERAAVREERRVEAYSELIQAAEEGTIIVSQAMTLEMIEEEGIPADPEARAELAEEYGTPFAFYREKLEPAIARVRLVGSDRMAELAIDLRSAYLLALGDRDEIATVLDVVVEIDLTSADEIR